MRSASTRSTARPASRDGRRRRASERRSPPAPRRRPNPTPGRLRLLGAAILVSGWLAAAVVVERPAQAPDAVEYQVIDGQVYPLTLAESRRTRLNVQRMNGDLGLWFAEFDDLLRSLLRPPRLAWTLLLLSGALGAACLGLAKLSAEEDAEA